MKYLVVKGWLGFGDRLETLKMAVKYALDNKLQIYVDWKDSIWSHDNESFYTYFKLINMPILESLDDIPSDATVYPPYWKDHMKESITDELLSKKNDLKLDLGMLNKFTPPPNIDVVVVSSIGNRTLYFDSTFFANVFRVVDPRITSKVNERDIQFALSKSVGVHIRGTDRKKNEGQFINKIQWLSVSAIHSGALNNVPMIAVTDDPDGLNIWKRFFPQTKMLTQLGLTNSSNKGNHNASKESLKNTKDELNVDMLSDFFTLASCVQVITTYKDSRFAQESQRLHPHIKTVLS
jgi:hypothetical protein